MLAIMLLYVGVGIMFAVIAVPLIQGRVRPNSWYGFRTPKTLGNKRVWYAANSYSGRCLFLAGVVIALSAMVLAPFGLIPAVGSHGYALLSCWLMIASLVWVLAASIRHLRML